MFFVSFFTGPLGVSDELAPFFSAWQVKPVYYELQNSVLLDTVCEINNRNSGKVADQSTKAVISLKRGNKERKLLLTADIRGIDFYQNV